MSPKALSRTIDRLRAAAGRLARRTLHDKRGTAAVEFGLILPVMLIMYVGSVDLTRGVMASRKVDIMSRTLSDLVAQQQTSSTITSSQVQTILTASSAIMRPFSTTSLKMTVSAVTVAPTANKTCCSVTVDWSYTQGGTLRPCNTQLTLVDTGFAPAPTNFQKSLITANATIGGPFLASQTAYFIVADVTYVYSPFMSQAVPWFSGTMKRTTYMLPRSPTGQVEITTPISTASGQSGASC